MSEALFCLKVPDELPTATFTEFGAWQRKVCGSEVCREFGRCGFFTNYEHLALDRRDGNSQEGSEESPSVRARHHGSTSDTQQLALSLPF
jgi:hypothetical protein